VRCYGFCYFVRSIAAHLPLPRHRCRRQELALGRNLYQDGGKDRHLYRAVNKQGKTVDFLLTATRDSRAARRFSNYGAYRRTQRRMVE
jgi:transposase-like protein